VFFDEDFQFHDGQTGEKLFLVLGTVGAASLVAKTTSKQHGRGLVFGCQPKDRFHNFYLPPGSCYFKTRLTRDESSKSDPGSTHGKNGIAYDETDPRRQHAPRTFVPEIRRSLDRDRTRPRFVTSRIILVFQETGDMLRLPLTVTCPASAGLSRPKSALHGRKLLAKPRLTERLPGVTV
jgi:hypothetical protein